MKVQRNIWRYISSYKQKEKLHDQKKRKIGKSENIFQMNISAQFSTMYMNFSKLPLEKCVSSYFEDLLRSAYRPLYVIVIRFR